MDELTQFLKSQRLMTLATCTQNGPWVANVFYGVGKDLRLYFISSEVALHSISILKDAQVAFNIAWYEHHNHKNRKAIQGQGVCQIATDAHDISVGVQLHNSLYPEFSTRITVEWINNIDNKSHVWFIDPQYIKYWDDELYGATETKEFEFYTCSS